MEVNYTTDAFAILIQLVNYIETSNTEGAGLRWLSRYEIFLQKKLSNAQKVRPCSNRTFKKLKLRCIHFNDWLIAFSIHEDFTLIEAILHKSRISD
ncbi:MAG: type II toxin-antitoxin system RelE/ParE family toxin [Ginsengibacter sp.]